MYVSVGYIDCAPDRVCGDSLAEDQGSCIQVPNTLLQRSPVEKQLCQLFFRALGDVGSYQVASGGRIAGRKLAHVSTRRAVRGPFARDADAGGSCLLSKGPTTKEHDPGTGGICFSETWPVGASVPRERHTSSRGSAVRDSSCHAR